MKQTIIRYRTHPERAAENEGLIEKVFAELATQQPAGVRYIALRQSDATFYHLVMAETDAGTSPITQLAAFRAFQAGIRERCVEAPQQSEVTIVGSYRMVGG